MGRQGPGIAGYGGALVGQGFYQDLEDKQSPELPSYATRCTNR